MEACCITEDDIQYSFTKQSEAAVRKLDESSSAAAATVVASCSCEVESYSHHYEDKSKQHQQVESNCKDSQKQLFPLSKCIFHGVKSELYYCDTKDDDSSSNNNGSSVMQHNDNHLNHQHVQLHHHHQSAEISLLTTITEGTESSSVSTAEWPIYPKILRKKLQFEHGDFKYDVDNYEEFKADYKMQDRMDYK
jgi:hypothetical protein